MTLWLMLLMALNLPLARPAGWGHDPAQWRLTAGGEELPDEATRPERRPIDDDRGTSWSTLRPMRPGDWLALDFGQRLPVTRLHLEPGERREFPKKLLLETSTDGERWTALRGVEQAISDEGTLRLEFARQTTRYLRLVNRGTATELAWSVAELYVWGD